MGQWLSEENMCGIFQRRKDEGRRFETEGGGNFFFLCNLFIPKFKFGLTQCVFRLEPKSI